MHNYITFNGQSLASYGVYVNGRGTYSAPARTVNMVNVPGRDGDYVNTVTQLQNIIVTYPAFIVRSFQTNIATVRDFLLSQKGYKRLVDTYDAEHFRLACYAGPLDVQALDTLNAANFDLSFNCMPQRWLLTGETTTQLTASGTISNPTRFASKPLLRVYGKGNLTIGNTTITIASGFTGTDMYIDCDTGYAYDGGNNYNRYVSVSGIDFPTLAPGSNNITLGTGITKIVITPRWWTV